MQHITRELKRNWAHIRSLATATSETALLRMFPSLSELQTGVVPDEAVETAVFLPRESCTNVYEVRDWLADNETRCQVRVRYLLRQAEYQTERLFLGLTFCFECIEDAFLFKFRFYRPCTMLLAA